MQKRDINDAYLSILSVKYTSCITLCTLVIEYSKCLPWGEKIGGIVYFDRR